MLTEWLKHTEFAYGWILGLLLLIPIMVYEYIRRFKRMEASMDISTTNFLTGIKSIRTMLHHLPFILRCIALVCLIVALARPQIKFNEEHTTGEGIDIVLCFDISGSMTAKDFQPNRLEASKEVATEFVRQRQGDRIGIVIFSNLSFTLCPVTTDLNSVLAQISNIQSGYLQEEGTAIGSGIATSVDRLRHSKSKTKIIILLTDGVDFGGAISPDIARDMAKLYGIKIYTIGIGSDTEMNEVVNSPFGPMTERKKLEFNEGLLKDLAQSTNGQYFHATDNDALQKIYTSINQLEKSKIEITTYHRFTEEYLPWLITGLLLILLEMVLRLTVFRKFP